MPLNVYFIVILFFSTTLNIFGAIYLSTYAVIQMLAIFGLHYALIKISPALHGPSYLLFKLYSGGNVMITGGDTKWNLKLAFWIEAMNGDNRYGVTYDRFGRVTMGTFSQVSEKARLERC